MLSIPVEDAIIGNEMLNFSSHDGELISESNSWNISVFKIHSDNAPLLIGYRLAAVHV